MYLRLGAVVRGVVVVGFLVVVVFALIGVACLAAGGGGVVVTFPITTNKFGNECFFQKPFIKLC